MFEIWLTIILAGLLTYLTRLSFIFLEGRWQPPELLRRSLRFVPPAVLTAIIFPELMIQDQALIATPLNPRLLAGLVAAWVAWRSRNILLSIGTGLACFYLLRFLLQLV